MYTDNLIRNVAKGVLSPFPQLKRVLVKNERRLRTAYLRWKHPNGGFLSCNGVRVCCDFRDPNYVWYDGYSEYLEYELSVFNDLLARRAPDVVLDVGAHFGIFPASLTKSLNASRIKRVICVEPDSRPFAMLVRTVAATSGNGLVVQAINAAISDRDGTVGLYSGGGMCRQTYSSSGAVSIGSVKAVSLDSLVKKYLDDGEVITHVKLDIDGYEPAFFAGGEATIAAHRPLVMMEFWPEGLARSGKDIAAYWQQLQGRFFVKEASFSKKSLVDVPVEGLPALIESVAGGITNLVLFPK